MIRAISAGAAAAILGVSTLVAVPAQADPMSLPEAAGMYMAYMCRANAAMDRVGDANDKYDKHDGVGDKISKQTRAAARRGVLPIDAVSAGFASREWPEAVAADVQQLAVGYHQYALSYATIAGSQRWPDLEWPDLGVYSTPIRAALGLPKRGRGC